MMGGMGGGMMGPKNVVKEEQDDLVKMTSQELQFQLNLLKGKKRTTHRPR